MLIDLHSHVLPEIDDGARSLEESLALVAESAAQGVGMIAATPHFYSDHENMEHFRKKRDEAYARLISALPEGSPEILLGAEMTYFSGIGHVSAARELCIGSSDLLLLEMPEIRWSNGVVGDVLQLHNGCGVTVVIAHIERSARFQRASALRDMRAAGILFQSNADFFVSEKTRKSALKAFARGEIDVLGSDCHNTEQRPPRMAQAAEIIASRFGREAVDRLNDRLLQMLAPVPKNDWLRTLT